MEYVEYFPRNTVNYFGKKHQINDKKQISSFWFCFPACFSDFLAFRVLCSKHGTQTSQCLLINRNYYSSLMIRHSSSLNPISLMSLQTTLDIIESIICARKCCPNANLLLFVLPFVQPRTFQGRFFSLMSKRQWRVNITCS